jgi:hypothetical protein
VSTHVPTLSTADRALLAAVATWSGSDRSRLWERFSPEWRQRLESAEGVDQKPEDARSVLARDHIASLRPDSQRVHPSWYVRALQDESPAIRLAVARNSAEPIAGALRAGLGLSDADLAADHPTHPEALRWALSLWAERLVGGPPPGPDDEPVVALFAGLDDSPARERFASLLALAKWGYAMAAPGLPPDFESRHPLKPPDRLRLDDFRAAWGDADPRLAHLALLDLSSSEALSPFLPRLGLVTIARLLSGVEATRVRWLLQHLPYDVAKYMRARMNLSNAFVPRRILTAWEGEIFRAATERHRADELNRGDSR